MESTRSSRGVAGPLARRLLFCLAAASICAAVSPAQIPEAKLLASDGLPLDRFGTSVALLPEWVFCGSPFADGLGDASGAVYVYEFDGAHWVPSAKLIAGGAWDLLGSSVAASGSWMVAGAPNREISGVGGAGSAHVFQLQGGAWVHTQKISSLGVGGYKFGGSVGLSGARMILGNAGSVSGIAIVFELSGSTWIQAKILSPSLGHPNDFFGSAVAIDGDVAVVGSHGHHNGVPGSKQGAAWVYERSPSGPGSWNLKQKLTARVPKNGDQFGLSVALDGETILVGSRHTHATPDDGGVFVFERQAGTWNLTQELRASDPLSRPQMGEYVALDGDLAIGSAVPDGDYGPLSGSAYVFRRDSTGTWLQIAKAFAPDAAPNARFGNAVALCDTKLLVGAAGDDWPCLWNPVGCNAGSAYVFELAPDAVQYGDCPTQGPCGNHDDFGGCAASLGYGGVLSAAGSASVAQDDLRLEARWLPLHRLGLFLMGDLAISQPFADGQLCVGTSGAGVWRYLPPQSSGAQGVMKLGPGVAALSSSFPAAGQISAGQTWHFQAWYRDPIGPCGTGSNLTSALRVTFQP